LDKYFNRTTSENEEKAPEEPHHSGNGNNVDSQPDDVMSASQSGCLYTRSEISHFESVESTTEGSWSAGASDESYEQENKTFSGTY